MQNKHRLRRKYFFLRKKKYFNIKPIFFRSLFSLLKKKYQKKKINISIYYPSSFEVNVLEFLKLKSKILMRILLPVVENKNLMFFCKWNPKDILQINRFGMLEPIIKINHIVPDVMLVPMLAYDDKKNRLGYGKGFYDRYLKKYLKKNKNILTIGIAFSFQKYNKLPMTSNDVKLNYILTDKGIF